MERFQISQEKRSVLSVNTKWELGSQSRKAYLCQGTLVPPGRKWVLESYTVSDLAAGGVVAGGCHVDSPHALRI